MLSIALFRNRLLTTLVCTLVSVQVFNLSIDPVDTLYGKEDLSVNEIESCVELILEVLLDQPDAVQENDESDESPDRPGPKLTVFTISDVTTVHNNSILSIARRNYIHTVAHPESLILAIIPPPPRA